AFVQIELQCGEVGDGCAVEQGDGAVYVFVAVCCTAQPEDDGGGDFHAAGMCLVQHFGHALLRGTLGDLFQDEVGAGFDAEVEQVEFVFAQQGEFFGALALDVAGRGVAGDARQARQCSRQFAQDGEQVFRRQCQRITISEEHAVRIRPIGGGLADVGEHRYMAQKLHWLKLHPSVAWMMRLSPSEGGRNSGMS
ncbi:MAG: hypothetical protein FD121_491, partial [Gallionellaceae bacterium]